MQTDFDVIIIGAGAAGLMCAIEAGKRGRSVWLIDHAEKLGEKIRISGGGRCNFTNIHVNPQAYLSQNPHFCKSAFKQFTQNDFIAMVERHGIAWHEKHLGQLFCDESAQDIIAMLKSECYASGVKLDLGITVHSIETKGEIFSIKTNTGIKTSAKLVIATGGLSIPKIGATKFGYEIARQFGHTVIEPRPALVPLTFSDAMLKFCKTLSGLSIDAVVSCGKTSFREGLLFTHRGLSGPSILQISSYYKDGDSIIVNLAPDTDIEAFLKEKKQTDGKCELQTVIAEILPKRLAGALCEKHIVYGLRLGDLTKEQTRTIIEAVSQWTIKPSGTEGYRTAEVTLGGVDTDELSSKTMESKLTPGLYFIGEVVDVTGHLGGFNFQWAWSSGYVAGNHL